MSVILFVLNEIGLRNDALNVLHLLKTIMRDNYSEPLGLVQCMDTAIYRYVTQVAKLTNRTLNIADNNLSNTSVALEREQEGKEE